MRARVQRSREVVGRDAPSHQWSAVVVTSGEGQLVCCGEDSLFRGRASVLNSPILLLNTEIQLGLKKECYFRIYFPSSSIKAKEGRPRGSRRISLLRDHLGTLSIRVGSPRREAVAVHSETLGSNQRLGLRDGQSEPLTNQTTLYDKRNGQRPRASGSSCNMRLRHDITDPEICTRDDG